MENVFSLNNRARRLAVWSFAVVCALLLAGCGTKEISTPQATATSSVADVDDAERLEFYRQTLKDDGIPLTDVEMRALLSEGELDRGLSPEEMREVQIYFKHYLHAVRPVMERFLQRSQPYMDYTVSVFRSRGMPEELAMLAYVESGYNPLAVSRSKAVGMWQFMAPTGRQYGLTQDWWMDERRDPYRATQAAADYLAKLYSDFGDWHLAVAAYNAGEGKIGRALADTGASRFFEMCRAPDPTDEKARLKEETKQYVPRFLAMCKVMRNAEALGLGPALPADGSPVLVKAVSVTARPGTDLALLAQRLDMPAEELGAYNPAFLRGMTPPNRHAAVYVPYHAAQKASLALNDDALIRSSSQSYVVAKNDTLGKISGRTGVPVAVLRDLNPKCEPLKAGARLRLPGKAATAVAEARPAPKPAAQAAAKPAPKPVAPAAAKPASAPKPQAVQASAKAAPAAGKHTIQAGDTLASVARQHGVSLAAMREANGHLADHNLLKAGQTLNVPGKAPAAVAAAKPAPKPAAQTAAKPAPSAIAYKVQPGDTMWSIARQFNIAPGDLLARNNMTRESTLKAGDTIRIPRE